MSTSPELSVDAAAVADLTARELARFEAATPRSRAMAERAGRSLAGGVVSDFQHAAPWPIHLAGGAGARVTDVDGVERIDFHNGFGATVHGHGNLAIAAAIDARYRVGSQFGAPTEDAIAVAEELGRRWRLPLWRLSNSGTEAAGDALRIARAATGRETVVRAAGGYHGVGVAEGPEVETVPFNDLPTLREKLAELERAGRPAACLILEPALMLGCVVPEAGYLAAAGEAVREAGGLLILDEAKTGLSIAPGGAAERFEAKPDLVVVAKALGGGLPAAAVGGGVAMEALVSTDLVQAGTFNGNPLAMAAARATLDEVLTPDSYARLEALTGRLVSGLLELRDRFGLAADAVGLGARGSLVFGGPVRDEATFTAARRPDLERLLWLYAVNRGLYLTPARPQNWTISIAHTPEDADTYLAVVHNLLTDLTAT